MVTNDMIDAVLAAWACAAPVSTPPGLDERCADLAARGRFHGVLPLIHRNVQADGVPAGMPNELVTACRDEAQALAAWDLTQRRAIGSFLHLLVDAGAHPLLLKGAALAYTHYAEPWQRPRADTDVLIEPDSLPAVEAALQHAGLEKTLQLPGDLVSYQSTWTMSGAGGSRHGFDLHWRINNSETLARLLGHAELAAEAVAVPELGPDARCPSVPHALLIACLHRAGSRDAPYHRGGLVELGGDRLIWLYDLVVLAASLGAEERTQWLTLVERKGAQCLVDDARAAAARAFPTKAAALVPLQPAAREADTPLDRYLHASPGVRRWLDFLAIDGLTTRLRFLRQQLWPSGAYLRQRYPERTNAPVTLLALSRIARALRRALLP